MICIVARARGRHRVTTRRARRERRDAEITGTIPPEEHLATYRAFQISLIKLGRLTRSCEIFIYKTAPLLEQKLELVCDLSHARTFLPIANTVFDQRVFFFF